MKILLATESYWPNVDGGSVFEHNLVLWLVKQKHKVYIIAPSPTGKYFVEDDQGSTIFRMPATLLLGRFLSSNIPLRKVAKIIREIKPDVVHIHNPFFIGFAARQTARKMGIPIIATNHNMPENTTLQFRWLKPLERMLTSLIWKYFVWFYNDCDFVTSPTQTAVNMLVEHGLKAPNKPVSNGIDLAKFKPEPRAKCVLKNKFKLPDCPVVLYTGRLDGEKRMDIWVKAIPYILKEVKAHFIIGGSGLAKKDIENMVSKMHLKDYVTFPGFLEEEEFIHLYHLADVFAIASPAELQSIVTLEALASGLPIVVADAAALPELVEEGKNGFTFQTNNPRDLAEKVTTILKDAKLRRNMSKYARQFVKRHDYHRSFVIYENLYKKLVGRHKV
jgi:glycosyltransferase involved in cell wall biosynthesis